MSRFQNRGLIVLAGLAALIILLLLLTGCGDSQGDPPAQQPQNAGGWVSVDSCNSDYCAKTVTVDGRKCVVFEAYRGGGISCDWSTPAPVSSSSP